MIGELTQADPGRTRRVLEAGLAAIDERTLLWNGLLDAITRAPKSGMVDLQEIS
jgi:hypothetical protein